MPNFQGTFLYEHEHTGIFSNLHYCVPLSKRDESKLVKLLAKTNLNGSQKQKSSSEIAKEIYGNHAGGFHEFVLAEATDKYDFDIKLLSFQEKWEALFIGFHDWFKRKRSNDFLAKLIRVKERETILTHSFLVHPFSNP